MNKPILPENPDFLENEIEVVSKIAKEFYDQYADISEIEKTFRIFWYRYKKEAQHYLEKLPDSSDETLKEIEQIYKDKTNFMAEEMKWQKIVDKAELKKLKAENDHQDSLYRLKQVIENRNFQVTQVVLPELAMKIYNTELRNLLNVIGKEHLRSDKDLKAQTYKSVSALIKDFRKRRLKRFLYRNVVERFWAFVVVAFLIEEILKNWISDVVKEPLEFLQSYSPIVRYVLLFVVLLILWELKRKFLDSRIEEHFREIKKKHLNNDIIDAAEAQTKLDCMKFYHTRFLEWGLKQSSSNK